MNFQAWLVAQGLNVQHGLIPKNNMEDSATRAWNDSITVSDEVSSDHSESAFAMVIVDTLAHQETVPVVPDELLSVTVEMHNEGMRFGLSTHGEMLMNILLADPIPRQLLNNALFLANRPILATWGPWSSGYGLRSDNLQVEIQVSVDSEGLQFRQMPNSTIGSSVIITDLNEPAFEVDQLTLETTPAMQLLPAAPPSSVLAGIPSADC